jgi:hypothetical protein
MECMCFEVKNGDGPRVVVGQEKGGDRGVEHRLRGKCSV